MNRYLRRNQLLAITLLVGILYLPFLNKAIHIDDPVVLRVTDNILADPFDPFAGDIDWFGELEPVWRVTTNPPLLSYYLAPFAAAAVDEVVLHVAMLPFVLVLTLGLMVLGDRFIGRAWWVAVFVVSSPAVVVSVNLMRDVPALAVSVAGIALFVTGVDRSRTGYVALGSLTAGMAVLIKYSAVVVLPVLIVYLVFKGAFRRLVPCFLFLLPLVFWCIFTAWRYGSAHPVYLMTTRIPGQSRDLGGHLVACFLILGCSLFLAPLLMVKRGPGARYGILAGLAALLAGPVASWCRRGDLDPQYTVAFSLGAGLVALVFVRAGRALLWTTRREERADVGFLLVWLLAALGSAILLVPFPAVRHLLPALPPLSLLVWRFSGVEPGLREWNWGKTLLLIQAGMALLVAGSDAVYAATYRDFARTAAVRWAAEEGRVWYVGHWGWQFYAQQAGFTPLHGDGEFPAAGDLLLWPKRVHIGRVFRGRREFIEGLELIDERIYHSALPVRTMNFEGAAFYATIRDNLPYRFHLPIVETMRVYRVGVGPEETRK